MKTPTAREAGTLLSRYTSATRTATICCRFRSSTLPIQQYRREFHNSTALKIVKPYLLADIGEGITECQVIQWFVKPGARVEQFDPICEVQSDKASVEITSRFDGVIKKLYYEADDMAKVGKPLVDIDIQSEISPEDEAVIEGEPRNEANEVAPSKSTQAGHNNGGIEVGRNDTKAVAEDIPAPSVPLPAEPTNSQPQPQRQPSKHASLAVPAVRHLLKQMKVNIEDIEGTGKDGRVTKEDVQKYAEALKKADVAPPAAHTRPSTAPIQTIEDEVRQLTPVQRGMFKEMTRSLSIPHFLYTDSVDLTALNTLRKKFNHQKEKGGRLSPLPFIIKAVSLSLQQYPLLNSHLNTSTEKPQIVVKSEHNIGIAVDSPSGLLVPVIRNVQSQSIESLAAEITRLSGLAKAGKLSATDLSGATFTVSNIGSIGGTAVAPVIVSPQVGILGIGRARAVPAFGQNGEIVKKEECVFSWSADHRIIDGAMAARCAESVRGYLENIETLLVRLR
ncbi:hypothetical protein GQ43DRAFT_457436 [Delitschia confertaspora ATCC 74209]|uniref:Dihydrolipoamide acetyltransferase component of pyruvate dehydrogenase complex n=1 Tax=Delitschia confertaspora ATCC 74209 TaxID=1513339 RepID=A0A9P4MN48_9PLEO|nr:hypothetical protein GQ43DRAFT_457436 [Delitschia confertaspora ATCC 74209]